MMKTEKPPHRPTFGARSSRAQGALYDRGRTSPAFEMQLAARRAEIDPQEAARRLLVKGV